MLTQTQTGHIALDGANDTGGRKRLTMLVTSAGRRVALLQAFRRGAEQLGVELELLACDLEPDLSAACHIADDAFAVPPATHDGYVDAVLAICRSRHVQLVVPTIDPDLVPLANAHNRFTTLGAQIAVSAPAVIDIARDKLKTAEFFATQGIPTPRTEALAAVRENPESWAWPVLLKPRHGSSGRAVSIIESPADLPPGEDEPMIVQTLLHGEEWTVSIYIDDAGRFHARDERKAGAGITTGPMMNVREVEADCRVTHQHLVRAGPADVDRLEAQFLWTAVLIDPDRVR